MFVGVIFGFCGEFHASIGLPDWVELPCFFLFVISIWMVVLLQRRAKKRGDHSFVPATPGQRRRNTWIMLIAAFLACVTGAFFPYRHYAAFFRARDHPSHRLRGLGGFDSLFSSPPGTRPNHALQRTSDRLETFDMITSTLKSAAKFASVGGCSAYSL
jgi:hypothetical protein